MFVFQYSHLLFFHSCRERPSYEPLAWLPPPIHPLTSEVKQKTTLEPDPASSDSSRDCPTSEPSNYLRQYPLLKPVDGPQIPRQCTSLTFRRSQGLDRRKLKAFIMYYDELGAMTDVIVDRLLRSIEGYLFPLNFHKALIRYKLKRAFLTFFKQPPAADK